MNANCKFLIIDDDPMNNALCEFVIGDALPNADIISHTNPEDALAYIVETSGSAGTQPTNVLLDINMPNMNGWEVLDELHKMDEKVLNRYVVFMLSSSVDERDKEKAAACAFVKDYFVKPITPDKVKMILRYNPCRETP